MTVDNKPTCLRPSAFVNFAEVTVAEDVVRISLGERLNEAMEPTFVFSGTMTRAAAIHLANHILQTARSQRIKAMAANTGAT